MKKFIFLHFIFILAFCKAADIGIKKFTGYQVLSVESNTTAQFNVLKNLYNTAQFDFWTNPIKNGSTDILVPPEEIQFLTEIFHKNEMAYSVKIDNIEKLLEKERSVNKNSESGDMTWTSYHSWDVIERWILSLKSSPIATVIKIGETFEKRNMYAVKISSGGGTAKKSILIDANIHAREWISGATATWILNELISNSTAYFKLLQQIDIYVIPIINIDGYEYSRTTNRMWRKTRSVYNGSKSRCKGCDPNRNFSFKFGGEGTSTDECSDIYRGPNAFSESETAAVRDFIFQTEATGVTFYAYLTFHSYSQAWLLPWGYTGGVYPTDYKEQLSLGLESVAALKAVHGTVYQTGQGADMLYGVGGASDDWAKNHGIKYTVTIEMRDTGRQYGFILPANQIIPNAEEIWAAVQVVCQRVINT